MVLALGVAALIVQFWGTAAVTVRTWYGANSYNHAFLIIPIVGYLFWDRRVVLSRLVPAANYWGLPFVALAAAGWLVGHSVGVNVVQQFALVALVQALFLTVLGWRVTRAMAFPLFYLFFAVPFGDFLVPPLQDLTAVFVVHGLQVVGIPVFSDGIFLSIPTGNFKVAEACAGVRYLIATTALSFLFANLFYRGWQRRVLFIGLGFVVPIFANGLRAFGIVMLAHLSDMTIAVGVDHLVYGWLFFAVVTMILLAIGVTFSEQRESDAGGGPIPGMVSAEGNPGPPVSIKSLIVAGFGAILISGGAVFLADYADARTAGRVSGLPVAEVRQPWAPLAEPSGAWHPSFPTADAESLQSYSDGNRNVDLYIAYYAAQRQDVEAVNSENYIADREVWSRAGSGTSKAAIDGVPGTVIYTRMIAGSRARIAWHWYWVDGEFTANPYMAKLLQARAKLFGGIPAAAAIVVAADYDETPAEARAAMRDFLRHLDPLAPLLAKVAGR